MRRRTALALTAVLIAASAALVSCASGRGPADPPGAVPTPTETIVHGDAGSSGPPPFVVRYDRTELQLAPVSWCYRTGCADGFDEDPPSVGSPDEVLVFVPVPTFVTLSASQSSGERWSCDSRMLEAAVEDLGGGWWAIHPQGPVDDYAIDLFASGDGGDMFATFRWTTTVDAPLPDPVASLALIADHDGRPDSYGLEFSVSNLSATPDEVSATITVTADNGRSLTFEAHPAEHCAGEGALFFDEPDAEALAASKLGDFPFTYDVTLMLDGVTHTATAIFPDDVSEEHGVAVPLEFAPALP
jgi:hypothetical protein